MKSFLGLLLLIGVVFARDHWEEFKERHKLSFTCKSEEEARFWIWQENSRRIEEHNKDETKSYKLKMNHFGHLTNAEFQERYLSKQKPRTKEGMSTYIPAANADIPETVDWREKGYVTHVKNQGQCGSCWSFSATGSLEGQMFRKTGKLIPLSEQQLVDCSTEFGDHGCQGGLMDNAFKYVETYGLESEEDYPYQAKNLKCRFNKTKVIADVKQYQDIEEGSEKALTEALAEVGPVSVAIDASHFSFQFYHSGVYDEPECSPEKLDHGVLAVGYGVYTKRHASAKYFLVKNSWGPGWGLEGYIRMSRGKENQCGIASAASYPIV